VHGRISGGYWAGAWEDIWRSLGGCTVGVEVVLMRILGGCCGTCESDVFGRKLVFSVPEDIRRILEGY